jgi:putative FmdB family regulatory protein
MPIYEYQCQDCQELFERLCLGGGDEPPVHCPTCGSADTQKLVSSGSFMRGSVLGSCAGNSAKGFS